MKCKECGCELEDGARFCSSCGKEVIKENCCTNCGELLPEGARFCSFCGTAVLDNQAEPVVSPIMPPEDNDSADERNTKEQPEPQVQQEMEQAVPASIPKPEHTKTVLINMTVDTFKTELKDLGDRDSESKAVIALFGTRVFEKYFYPLLRNNERLISIRHIRGKFLFARYRKEFVAVTDQRVIKFEKMQYCKPKTEICNISGITEINAAYASNAAVGAFAGEKLEIIHSCGRIAMSIIGKGAAYQFKDELLKLKEEVPENEGSDSGPSSIPPSSDMGSPHYNPPRAVKGGKKTLPIIGGVVVVLVIGMIIFAGLDNRGTGTELSAYISKPKAEVIKFAKKSGLEEMLEDSIYANNDLTLTLDDNGNIDSLSISTDRYSLYGLKVGQSFSVEKDGATLAANNYAYNGETSGRIVYTNTSNVGSSNMTPLIGITLDSSGNIAKLEYIKADNEDLALSGTGTKNQTSTGKNNSFILKDSDKRYVDINEIQNLSDYNKMLALYEIFARHGATFEDLDNGGEIQEYFDNQEWYTPIVPAEDIPDSDFNTYETSNMNTILNSVNQSADTTEPVQQNNIPTQQPIQTPESSTNQDLPDYITGSSTQLGIQNLYNIKYYAFDGRGIIMCIYDDPNANSVRFFNNNNDLIWEGSMNQIDTPGNGGLSVIVEGVNAYSGTFLSISWSSVNKINECVVNGSDDYLDLNNYYSTTIPQIQPQTQVQGDKGYGYVIEGSDSRYLTKDELMGMSKRELRLGRNEIYARHGRIFKSDDLNSYFNSMDWYYPTVPADQFNENVLNQYEKQNLITIKEVEDSK